MWVVWLREKKMIFWWLSMMEYGVGGEKVDGFILWKKFGFFEVWILFEKWGWYGWYM